MVLFVGEREVCRGGVPAPPPPMEGSSRMRDVWSSETLAAAAGAAAAAAAGDGDGDGGSTKRGSRRDVGRGVRYFCWAA